ncbi:YcnI family protein [Ramlibacter sp.]|uniref:YcnI family copper-binding membrane protein n=1 Tax=Ramlibacter sp. TaxID=1917967 RepID=UPI002D2C5199|nr:YcnI family protein [Ramlibacter sp.]HYD77375.1 YcnI family protein [Ramlibacter sp.]
MKHFLLSCASAAAFGIALPAAAHVALEQGAAPAGSSYKATFKVGHGCGSSATRQLVVSMPAGVLGARPMPKPGWTVAIDRAPLPKPVSSHGRTVSEAVTRITWTARSADAALPSDQYDEFVLVAQLPAEPGPLYWPVSQVCEQGRVDWAQLPQARQKAGDLKEPAAVLEVLPAGGHSHGHRH